MKVIDLVFYVCGGISSVAWVVLAIWSVYSRLRCITMAMLPNMVKDLSYQLTQAKYQPDVLLGIGRGGIMLAGLLSEDLGTIPIAVLDRREIRSATGYRTDVEIRDNYGVELHGKNVLLVSAECNRGITFIKARELATKKNVADVRTLSLYSLKASAVHPDFSVREYRKAPKLGWKRLERDNQ